MASHTAALARAPLPDAKVPRRTQPEARPTGDTRSPSSSNLGVNNLAPAVGTTFSAFGRVVKAGRKQIFTAGELHAVDGDRSKLVATATAILVPAG